MATIVTNKALEGWNATALERSPYLATSVHSDAWNIGRWLHQTGRTIPQEVRKSRGDTYYVNGMKVRMHYVNGSTQIERIA